MYLRAILALVIALGFAAPSWACEGVAGIRGQVYSYSAPQVGQVRYIQAPQRIEADAVCPCETAQIQANYSQPVIQREVAYGHRQQVILRDTAGYGYGGRQAVVVQREVFHRPLAVRAVVGREAVAVAAFRRPILFPRLRAFFAPRAAVIIR